MQPLGPKIAEHRAKGARNKHREPKRRRRVEGARPEAGNVCRTRRPCPFQIHDRVSAACWRRTDSDPAPPIPGRARRIGMSTATHNPDCVSALEGASRTSAPIRSEMALTMERPKPEPA